MRESGAPWLGWVGPSPLVRVVDLPRPFVPEGRVPSADPFGLERLALLVSQFHSGDEPVGLVWLRSRTGGPVELLGLGRSVFPLSARTVPVADVTGGFSGFPAWTGLTARFDALRAPGREDDPAGSAGRRPSLEGGLLSVWNEPFALVVLASPVRSDELAEVVRDASDKVRRLRQFAESNPDREVEYERLKAWHRELWDAESSGLWRVAVWAGGVDAAASAAVAGLTVASVDLSDSPYVLAPTVTVSDVQETKGSAFLAGSELVSALARTPVREVPGIRLVLQPDFDVTAESQHTDGVQVGAVLDQALRPSGQLRLSLPSLNRHTFVCGATGAGKSQTVRHLLAEATKQGIPWLVLEPAKAEYARMAARLPDHEVIVVRPGDPSAIPAGIDPLRPAAGFPLQTHLDLVRALFLAAFDADEPFPQVLSAALTKAYEEQGWDVVLSESLNRQHTPRYPTLADLEQAALRIVRDIGYGQEVADNVRGFVKVRLASLRLGTTGRFLEGGHPFDIGELLRSNVVLEIEDVGDDRDKSFMIGTVLIALTEHLRVAQRTGELKSGELRHLTVIEEAHRLLRRTEGHGAAAQAVEMFASLLAEVRAYGEGLVVAEQIPAKLIPDVIKNTAIKIVHRLPAKDDRDAVGATMNLSQAQSAYLVTLEPGTAGVFADGMDQPLLVRMPDGTQAEALPASTKRANGIVLAATGRCQADYGLTDTILANRIRGQRWIEDNPLIRWWAELAVLAHLVGRPVPGVSPPLWPALIAAVPKVGVCGLAHAVDEAVAVRSSLLSDRMSPAGLAEHVYAVLLDLVNGGPGCVVAEPEWLAAPYKWEYVARYLRAYIDKEPFNAERAPHPDTLPWQAVYGGRVPGRNGIEQMNTLTQWRREAQSTPDVEDIAFGTTFPSAPEKALNSDRNQPDWRSRVERTLRSLDAAWGLNYHLIFRG